MATSTQTVAAGLALLADGVAGDDGPAAGQEGGEHLEELVAVDRAAVQLEVDRDVRRDGRRGVERLDVLGVRVDGTSRSRPTSAKFRSAWMPPGRGAGPDRDEETRGAADRL